MDIKIGCDIVFIARFHQLVMAQGDLFLQKIFYPEETQLAQSIDSLAGYFALKEAVFKALDFCPGDWHDIKIFKYKSGKPGVEIIKNTYNILSYDVSISHDNGYALAYSCFLLKRTYI